MKIVTNDNYFEDDEYMSVSAFKKFKYCELSGLKKDDFKSEALLVGSYVDACVEGTLDKFISENPSIFSSRGSTKGELKSEYKYADTIYDFIKNDKVFSQFMSGEKQTIMTGEIAGVPFKIKMDSYSPDIAINDLKVMRSVTDKNGNFYDFITPWGYDIQMACYQEIVRQNSGKQLLCYICAVTKETPINSVIVNIPQAVLDKTLYGVESQIRRFYDIKMKKVQPIGCGKCSSCISSREYTPIISMMDLMGEGEI